MIGQHKIEELTNNLKKYIDIRTELMELQAADKLSIVAAETISGFTIGLFGMLFIFFMSLGFGFYISSLIGSLFTGFFIVAGFYFLIFLFVLSFRKNLMSKPLRNRIIKEIFSEN